MDDIIFLVIIFGVIFFIIYSVIDVFNQTKKLK